MNYAILNLSTGNSPLQCPGRDRGDALFLARLQHNVEKVVINYTNDYKFLSMLRIFVPELVCVIVKYIITLQWLTSQVLFFYYLGRII